MSLLDRFNFRVAMISASALTGISSTYALTDNSGGITGLATTTPDKTSIIAAIASVVSTVLDFVALLAVIFIIVAGLRLIISNGNEESMNKSKKTIIYVAIGLVVVLLARVIVGFFINPSNLGLATS